MSQRTEQSAWEYVPGLLELIEEGVEPAELGECEFAAPQMRSRAGVDKLWNWLKGFRYEATLCEREQIWVPIAEVWPAPGGSAEFRYETASEREASAEISVASAAGFGGASRRALSSSIRLPIDEVGLSYETKAFLTLRVYKHQRTGEEMRREDVDCAGATGEYRSRDLDPAEHPFGSNAPDREQLKAAEYVVQGVELCSQRSSETERTWREKTLRSWNVSVGLDVPGVGTPLKLGVTCQNSKAFETEFVLPGRHDYAFCARRGQAPIVPLCVHLSGEDGSGA